MSQVCFFSRPEMKEFIRLYQDFLLLDGTHKTNVYDLRLMPLAVVDCLGYTMPVGVLLAPSESTDAVQLLFETLGIEDNPEYCVMTEEGAAFVSYCSGLQRSHLLCTHHFRMKAMEVSGMPAEVKTSFLTEVSFFLYFLWKTINSESEFNQNFQTFKDTYSIYSSASKFIAKLEENKRTVIAYYTQNVFTAGAFTTQRSESLNAMLKLWGELKKSMTSWNLVEIIQ